jgi:hypothetical protein
MSERHDEGEDDEDEEDDEDDEDSFPKELDVDEGEASGTPVFIFFQNDN